METEDNQFKILNKTMTKCGIEKVTVDICCLKKYLLHLKNSAEFEANMLHSIMASDFSEFIELNYNLYSEKLNKYLIVSVKADRNNPNCESVTDIYKSALFDEREIFDLFGVFFEGHKDLKRIFMPQEAEGYPLRKDFNPKNERPVLNEADS